MTSGNYSVTGGFWSLFAVQTPGAPSLRIFLTSFNTAAVTWPSPSTGWLLQQNTNSNSSVNWSNVIATIQDNGTTKTLVVSPPTGQPILSPVQTLNRATQKQTGKPVV